MGSHSLHQRAEDRRSEAREPSQRYYSVQFTTSDLDAEYQFKLRDISSTGMCILVREDSELLNHLQVGDILEMTYYMEEAKGGRDKMKTRIRHITKNEKGRYQGHSLVGLTIL